MQIIECNDEVLSKYPNIYQVICDVYDGNDVVVYAVLSDNSVNFICFSGEHGLYIDNRGHRSFNIDKDYNVSAFQGNKYLVYYGDNTTFRDYNNNEYKLELISRKKELNEGYDGIVVLTEYMPDKDLMVQLSFLHAYREVDGRHPIYSMYIHGFNSMYIEEEFSKKPFKGGFLPKRVQAYGKLEYERNMLGYHLALIYENGLLEYLLKGSYNLERDNRIKRYNKAFYLDTGGELRSLGFLGDIYKEEDIVKIMNKYGIKDSIDKEMIALYNEEDYYLSRIKKVLNILKKEKDKKDLGVSLSLLRKDK